MDDRLKELISILIGVSEEIDDYAYDHYRLPAQWEGREVAVVKPPVQVNFTNSAGRSIIVTEASGEVLWLLGRLRDAFGRTLNYTPTWRFYARLGDVISEYARADNTEYNVNGLLRTMMDETFAIFKEMELEACEDAELDTQVAPACTHAEAELVAA